MRSVAAGIGLGIAAFCVAGGCPGSEWAAVRVDGHGHVAVRPGPAAGWGAARGPRE